MTNADIYSDKCDEWNENWIKHELLVNDSIFIVQHNTIICLTDTVWSSLITTRDHFTQHFTLNFTKCLLFHQLRTLNCIVHNNEIKIWLFSKLSNLVTYNTKSIFNVKNQIKSNDWKHSNEMWNIKRWQSCSTLNFLL